VNASLAYHLVEGLFPGDGSSMSVGVALAAAKSILSASISYRTNSQKYHLLGDPAVVLPVPERAVVIHSDTLRLTRGAENHISGEVLSPDGELDVGFRGECRLVVHGRADTTGYSYIDTMCPFPHDGRLLSVQYDRVGPILYEGVVDVIDGNWSADFFVPFDASAGGRARIRAYAMGDGGRIEGAGADDSVRVEAAPGGSEPDDDEGPRIVLTVDGAPIEEDSPVWLHSRINLHFEDESGIYIQETDPFLTPHLYLDRTERFGLVDRIRFDRNGYQKAGTEFLLADLVGEDREPGAYEILLRASDNLGNQSEYSVDIHLTADEPTLAFRQEVLNYPNPFDPEWEETEFFVDLTAKANVSIQVYTISGKRIRAFGGCLADGATRLADCNWDGRDADGDPVANGVYLIRAIAESPDRSIRVESMGKAMIRHSGR